MLHATQLLRNDTRTSESDFSERNENYQKRSTLLGDFSKGQLLGDRAYQLHF